MQAGALKTGRDGGSWPGASKPVPVALVRTAGFEPALPMGASGF